MKSGPIYVIKILKKTYTVKREVSWALGNTGRCIGTLDNGGQVVTEQM